jgi:hypothetical protein
MNTPSPDREGRALPLAELRPCKPAVPRGLELCFRFLRASARSHRRAGIGWNIFLSRRLISICSCEEWGVSMCSSLMNSPSPILFRLPLHRRCFRVLHLQPVARAPRDAVQCQQVEGKQEDVAASRLTPEMLEHREPDASWRTMTIGGTLTWPAGLAAGTPDPDRAIIKVRAKG